MGSQIKLLRSRILEPGKDVPVFTCVCVYSLSGVHCFATPWTIALQGPLFMEFPRWEYWGELPFPSPGDRPDPRLEPGSPALQVDSLPLSQQGSPPVFIPLCLCCALLSSRSQKKKISLYSYYFNLVFASVCFQRHLSCLWVHISTLWQWITKLNLLSMKNISLYAHWILLSQIQHV